MKLAYPILRSLEDGHQTIGPPCGDRMGIDAYKRAFYAVKRQVWKLEAFVWVTEKHYEGFSLFAEVVEKSTTIGGTFMLINGRRP